jgi:uncharacterized protein
MAHLRDSALVAVHCFVVMSEAEWPSRTTASVAKAGKKRGAALRATSLCDCYRRSNYFGIASFRVEPSLPMTKFRDGVILNRRSCDSIQSLPENMANKLESVWHEGEMLVQERAGVREAAEELTGMYRTDVLATMAGFLSQQRFAVLTTRDHRGRVWASLVTGNPGMLHIVDASTIVIDPAHLETRLQLRDVSSFSTDPIIGMIVIDFSRRIRVRINGAARLNADGGLTIAIQQLYGNCSHYIQRRTILPGTSSAAAEPVSPTTARSLSESQQQLIGRADTFFIGSAHPERGADASHRGGQPGFVRIVSPTRISFPDYVGNNMFNTLGNIAVNPSIGLLFLDFESGQMLQLTGRASIDWDDQRKRAVAGAERMIDVDLDEIREPGRTALKCRFESYSPFNPQT